MSGILALWLYAVHSRTRQLRLPDRLTAFAVNEFTRLLIPVAPTGWPGVGPTWQAKRL